MTVDTNIFDIEPENDDYKFRKYLDESKLSCTYRSE